MSAAVEADAGVLEKPGALAAQLIGKGKLYAGERAGSVVHVSVIEAGASRPLNPRRDLRNHSLDGFQWGYGGSGPSQLALAMVADATADADLALRCYQDWKREWVAGLQVETWTLPATTVIAWAAMWRQTHAA